MIFILRHDDPTSHEYANTCAESCDAVGMEWEYFDGFCGISPIAAAKTLNILPEHVAETPISKRGPLCTLSHVAIWKKMIDENIPQAIILEHDAIMLHPFNLDVPDNAIVALGYRLRNPKSYNHKNTEEPQKIYRVRTHRGSHAYALTRNTAQTLYSGVLRRKSAGCIDIHVFSSNKYREGVELMICDPICSIAWIRQSTIQARPSDSNYEPIKSFRDNLS